MARLHHPARGILLMILASASFALMAGAIKAVSGRLSATEIVFVRSLLGLVFIAGLVAKTRSSWIGRQPRFLVARGVVGFIAMILYFWTLTQIDLGTAIMLNYTSPIFAVILAHALFHEKTSWITKSAVLLSFAGVYLLASPQLQDKPLPLLIGLLAGLFVGMVHILIRYSHAEEQPLTIIFYFTAISVMGSGLLLLKSGWVMPAAADWPWLLVITVSSMTGQMGLTYSLRSAPISIVSPFAYLTPVFGIFLGWRLWGETLPATSMAGCALIVLCGLMTYRYRTA